MWLWGSEKVGVWVLVFEHKGTHGWTHQQTTTTLLIREELVWVRLAHCQVKDVGCVEELHAGVCEIGHSQGDPDSILFEVWFASLSNTQAWKLHLFKFVLPSSREWAASWWSGIHRRLTFCLPRDHLWSQMFSIIKKKIPKFSVIKQEEDQLSLLLYPDY